MKWAESMEAESRIWMARCPCDIGNLPLSDEQEESLYLAKS